MKRYISNCKKDRVSFLFYTTMLPDILSENNTGGKIHALCVTMHARKRKETNIYRGTCLFFNRRIPKRLPTGEERGKGGSERILGQISIEYHYADLESCKCFT